MIPVPLRWRPFPTENPVRWSPDGVVREITTFAARDGVYAKGLDGHIDDPNAGRKGRGLWSTNGNHVPWHMEGGKETKPLVVHVQVLEHRGQRAGSPSWTPRSDALLDLGCGPTSWRSVGPISRPRPGTPPARSPQTPCLPNRGTRRRCVLLSPRRPNPLGRPSRARLRRAAAPVCPACGGGMKILAFLTDPPVVSAPPAPSDFPTSFARPFYLKSYSVRRYHFQWDGIVLAGCIIDTNDNFRIDELSVGGMDGNGTSTVIRQGTHIDYDRCNAFQAGLRLSHFETVGGTWWESM